MSLISNNPTWYVLFCIAAGFLFAGILYYKTKKDGFESPKRYLMAGLRFVSVFLISFLLLAFLLKIERRRTEKPIVVLLHDNTESLSDFSKNNPQWFSKWADFSKSLKGQFEIEQMTFGKDISTSNDILFDEKQTNIANALSQIRTQFYGRNLSAVVLASDGIYTAGEHPLQAAENLRVPVFTVALGDTTEYKDVWIHRVNHNRYAYLGNQFPINIELQATQLVGTKVGLTIQHEGQTVFSKEVNIDKPRFFETIESFQKATKTGVQRYVISVSTVEGERNVTNNRSEIFVEVLDTRRKILLLAAAPHPDISAIRNSILESERYEVDLVLDGNLKSPLEKYDVVILHQLPARIGVMNALVQQISTKQLPVWTIVGIQTDLNAFNKMNFGVTVELRGQQTNDAFPSFNTAFTNFTFSDESKNQLFNFPPLSVPFAAYTVAESAQTFLFQKILNVTTDMPLMIASQNLNNRSVVLLGEGIWRWRLNEFLQRQNHDAVNELVKKTIQYLSASADKRLFRVNVKPIFDETEPIEIDAELYNDSYEPVTSAEVTIEIKNEDGVVYPFTFSPVGNIYRLRAGLLPVGDYTFVAQTKLGNQTHQATGRFSVRAMNIEQLNLRADHQLLYLIAKQTDAEMVYPNQLDELRNMLISREDAKPVTYVEKGFHELINLKWILVFVILILSLEYFLRRYFGAY
ncbi:MAG: hypothetical protein LBH22_01765 [Bacteroidales bacterium]|jgi:hypothetical protein|nr:hypothetical protein [Bacteroidales bacterium]